MQRSHGGLGRRARARPPVLAGIRACKSNRLTFLCLGTVVFEGASRRGRRLFTVAGAAHLGRAPEAPRTRVSRLTARADRARGHQNGGIIYRARTVVDARGAWMRAVIPRGHGCPPYKGRFRRVGTCAHAVSSPDQRRLHRQRRGAATGQAADVRLRSRACRVPLLPLWRRPSRRRCAPSRPSRLRARRCARRAFPGFPG